MKHAHALSLVLCCIAGVASAQSPESPAPSNVPAKPTAQSEAGEPRANTSEAPPQAPPSPAPAAAGGAANAAAAAGSTSSAGPKAQAKRPATDAPAAQKATGKSDRLELGTATVTGDREQPKVMYIVPWKRSDIGDLAGKPMNSLVDEILADHICGKHRRQAVRQFDELDCRPCGGACGTGLDS